MQFDVIKSKLVDSFDLSRSSGNAIGEMNGICNLMIYYLNAYQTMTFVKLVEYSNVIDSSTIT